LRVETVKTKGGPEGAGEAGDVMFPGDCPEEFPAKAPRSEGAKKYFWARLGLGYNGWRIIKNCSPRHEDREVIFSEYKRNHESNGSARIRKYIYPQITPMNADELIF
jgi:hypothetical protein